MCNEHFFMKMLIYTIICILCHTNEWNLYINSRNVIVKNIENIMAYKKKFLPSILAMKN
jgi:hypothetical protein